MTQSPVLSPPAAEDRGSARAVAAAVSLASFAGLLLELSLTRLFSVVLFYHFAFLAISIALLGLGAGGVFAYVRRDWLARWPLARIGHTLGLAAAVAIVAALEVVIHTPVSLDTTRGNFARLAVIYLAAAVPFFMIGLLLSLVFARQGRRIAQLYGADLLGGALACALVVPLLGLIGAPNCVLLAAAAAASAAVLWRRAAGPASDGSRVAIAVTALLLVAIAANYSGKLVDIVYAKGIRRDQPWMLFAKWNAISRVEVNQQGESKYIVIDADASSAIMNVDPARWAEDTHPTPHDNGLPSRTAADSNASAPAATAYNWKRDLMAAAPALANVLRPRGDFAIIGPGGGVDVLRAVANGSQNVTGIEINPIIADTIMRGRYADYAYHLYELPQVHIHVGDGRSYLRASRERYDVVQMTLVDTWASTAAGAFALSENSLYTVEAFREYFDHLKPDGIIAITRWEFRQPREALRVVSQEIEALGGGMRPRNFLVVSDGALDEDGRPVTVLAKKTEFTPAEENAVLEHIRRNPNLFLIYAPSDADESRDRPVLRANPVAAAPFRELINSSDELPLFFNGRQHFLARYPYNISPVTDNAPFFFFTIRSGDVLRGILGGTGRGMDWRINVGVVVLFFLLVLAFVAVLAFLIVPLVLYGRAAGRDVQPRPRRIAGLLYFAAVGLGYILVEIAFIQRFVLFLGHPTYALTVVVFLMLLASGMGSLAARHWSASRRGRRLRVALALVIGGVAALVVVLPGTLASLVGVAFPLKLLLSAALLAPLAFAMGMPFPTGLRALAPEADAVPADEVGVAGNPDSMVEWAWAINAGSSVLGSVLAMVIAVHLGLNVTLAAGALAYAAALALTWPLLRRA